MAGFQTILFGRFRAIREAVASAALVVAACSSDGSAAPRGASDGTSSSMPTESGGVDGGGSDTRKAYYKCCLDDDAFACPDQTSAERCAGTTFDVGACHVRCGADAECHADCDQRSTEVPAPDTSTCSRVNVTVDQWCVRRPPSDDCTRGNESCSTTADCTLLGHVCNTAVGRCFFWSESCVGTRCDSRFDCSVTEDCDESTKKCVSSE